MYRSVLYSHVRNIDCFIKTSRVVYHIPIYNDSISPRVLSASVKDGSLVLVMERQKQIFDTNIHDAPPIQRQKGTNSAGIQGR
jgi:hypothetical protein